MAKMIKFDNAAKEKILAGVNTLEKAVSSTLGPLGRNVIIDEYGTIHSTKDGVTVAKSISLSDPFENMGAAAVKEVAEKSNDQVGDGTTTSTLLAASIYRNGLKYVSFGSNATHVKNGIKKAAAAVIANVRAASKPVSNKDDIKRVATVSANGDEKIGEMIADVMDKIGNDGTIKIENGNTTELTSKIVEGMVIEQSYVSPYMVTNAETMEAEFDNPYVLVVNKKLSNIQELVPCFQASAETGRPIVIIADEYQDDIIGMMIVNKMRGAFNGVAVKSPSYGDDRKAILDDIATLCGGRVVSDETGTKLENAVPGTGILGSAKRVVVTKEHTVIMGDTSTEAAVAAKAAALRSQISACKDDFAKNKLHERLAKLTSGIGVISVGAATEAERKELRDRVDDAFSAAKAACREGIVPGGGAALLAAKRALSTEKLGLTGDEAIGGKILLDSLDAPIRKILDNAGEDSSLIVAKISEGMENVNGYNVISGKYTDMMTDGVIDPTEVVINEVQNASSVAGLLLMTEALICEEPKKDGCSCGQHM